MKVVDSRSIITPSIGFGDLVSYKGSYRLIVKNCEMGKPVLLVSTDTLTVVNSFENLAELNEDKYYTLVANEGTFGLVIGGSLEV